MLNYSLHAIEHLSTITNLPPEDSIIFNQLLTLLHQSIKFELPSNGYILEDAEKSYDLVTPEMLHLPFPIVALEYPFQLFHNNIPGNIAVPKRIALCLDYHTHKDTPLGQTASKMPYVKEHGGIIMIPFFGGGVNQPLPWVPAIWGVVLPRIYDFDRMSTYYYGNPRKQANIGILPFPILPSPARASLEHLGPDRAVKDGLLDCGEEVTALVGFTAALSCSNVSMQDIPAPEKLNTKRTKANKLPFYSYKVVTVDTHRTTQGHSGVSISDRRGHIRWLSSGRNVWVQSAVIGSGRRGVVEKAYKVV